MAWDFETDPDFQAKLDWMQSFVDEQVEPLSYLGIQPYDVQVNYLLLNRRALAHELYPDPVGDIQDAAEAVA